METTAEEALDEIAAKLYALPPKEFTEARNTRARELGNAPLAAEVQALRKPLMAAWVVNLFAREQGEQLARALDLAAQLREAQDDLDARALTALGRQRRALVRALAQQASELAASRGEKPTQATSDAVEQTLNAAMFDVDAAAAVASGRLVRPLEAGRDPAELVGVVGGSLGARTATSRVRPLDEVKARRQRKQAESALRAAQTALTQAQRARDELDGKQKSTRERADHLDDRAKELEAELARVREDAKRLRRADDEFDTERSAAARRVEAGQREIAAAQAALDRLAADSH